jgi:hypothetical protein
MREMETIILTLDLGQQVDDKQLGKCTNDSSTEYHNQGKFQSFGGQNLSSAETLLHGAI